MNGGGYGWDRAPRSRQRANNIRHPLQPQQNQQQPQQPRSLSLSKTILWWRPRNGGQHEGLPSSTPGGAVRQNQKHDSQDVLTGNNPNIVGKRWRLNQPRTPSTPPSSGHAPCHPLSHYMTSIAMNEDANSIAFIDDDPSMVGGNNTNSTTPSVFQPYPPGTVTEVWATGKPCPMVYWRVSWWVCFDPLCPLFYFLVIHEDCFLRQRLSWRKRQENRDAKRNCDWKWYDKKDERKKGHGSYFGPISEILVPFSWSVVRRKKCGRRLTDGDGVGRWIYHAKNFLYT